MVRIARARQLAYKLGKSKQYESLLNANTKARIGFLCLGQCEKIVKLFK